MPIALARGNLLNVQQLEVAVNGPDGATHLIMCTGVAILGPFPQKTYSFSVGPKLSRRQFVGVIVSGAISTIQIENKSLRDGASAELVANLVSIAALFDDESGQVKVTTEVSSTIPTTTLAISYNVNILAELPKP